MVLDGRAAEVWNWAAHFAVQQAFHGQRDVECTAGTIRRRSC